MVFPAWMEADLFHEGSVFEKYGLYNKDVMATSTAESAGHPASGFTPTDLAALNELSVAALGQQRWSRCQVVHEPFADYLAAWAMDAGHSEPPRSEEHTPELQSHLNLVCRLLLEKQNISLRRQPPVHSPYPPPDTTPH